MVPPFKDDKSIEPVECKVLVVSGGKHSEPHRFMYLPELSTGKRNFVPIFHKSLLGFLFYLKGMAVKSIFPLVFSAFNDISISKITLFYSLYLTRLFRI